MGLREYDSYTLQIQKQDAAFICCEPSLDFFVCLLFYTFRIGFILEIDNLIFSSILNHQEQETCAKQVKQIIDSHPSTVDFHTHCRRRGRIRGFLSFIYLVTCFSHLYNETCENLNFVPQMWSAYFLLPACALMDEWLAPDPVFDKHDRTFCQRWGPVVGKVLLAIVALTIILNISFLAFYSQSVSQSDKWVIL